MPKVSADEKVREIYRLRRETEAAIISERNLYAKEAREKGRAEGRAEGREEGREEGRAEGERIGIEKAEAKAHQEKIESAKQALSLGVLSVEQVSQITGLTVEEIENLK